jgi:large subunit ribosomal protein L4
MVKAKLYNQAGEDKGEIKLNSKIFNIEISPDLIKQAILALLSNRRNVIAHAKGRSEVRGGGRKPWRQKGTGRARHGSTRSPIWKGGGVTFGPSKEQNFTVKINKKAKVRALFMTLSDKAGSGLISVLEGFASKDGKTKEVSEFLKKMKMTKGLVVIEKMDEKIARAFRNIKGVEVIAANSLNVYDTLNAKTVIFTKEALKVLEQTFLKTEK